jgi:hypothetical protein
MILQSTIHIPIWGLELHSVRLMRYTGLQLMGDVFFQTLLVSHLLQ